MSNEEQFPVCPRCQGFIPNNQHPGEYMGALSRADNETEVCSPCGLEEAMVDLFQRTYRSGKGHDKSKWPLHSDRAVPPQMVEALRKARADR